tara:strand:+ start:1788 stop:2072 length:285 start_codon:yes stop_codon:yes gene_type:complete
MKYSLVIEDEDSTRTIPIDPNERLVVDNVWYSLELGQAKTDRPYRSEEWLTAVYHGEGKTLKEIGDMCGVSPMTINQWLVKHGITSRPRGRRRE